MRLKIWTLVLALLATVPVCAFAEEEEAADDGITPLFVVNALPATLLIDMNGDKFTAEGEDGKVSMSQLFAMPNFSAGAGLDLTDEIMVDLQGGAGIVINDSFRSLILQAILGATFEVADSIDLGPRVGMVWFTNPEWVENDDVEFDDSEGLLLGVSLSMGDRIRYLVAVDYIDASMDAEAAPGVAADDEFELQGIAIQFGVRGEF